MTANRKIDNSRVIAGLLREALFMSVDVHISGLPGFKIVEILENSRRSRSEKRLIKISKKKVELQNPLDVTIHFSQFVVEFKSELASESLIHFPEEINIINRRKEARKGLKDRAVGKSQILVEFGNDHYEATFELDDFSNQGLGGTLIVPDAFKFGIGARVTGAIKSSGGYTKLVGVVKTMQTDQKIGDQNIFQIGILRQLIEHESSESDRRNEVRIDVTGKFHQLEFVSMLNPSQPILATIENVSIAGFSARLENSTAKDFAIDGLLLRLRNSTMVASVIKSIDNSIHCTWIHGEEPDRLNWLKSISKNYSEDLALTIPDAFEILKVFCESGSLGPKFLKSNRNYAQELTDGLEYELPEYPFIHRWINTTEDGQVRGHTSVVKVSDNSWMISDVIGSSESDSKLHPTFLARFSYSFRLFCEQSSPCPQIFMIWVENHKFWEGLAARISPNIEELGSHCKMGYTRFSDPTIDIHRTNISVEKINPSNHEMIRKIRDIASPLGLVGMLDGIDFCVGNFGSPRLRNSIASTDNLFSRNYYCARVESKIFLIVLTSYPLGTNPNRLVDSAWVFDFNSGPISDVAWAELQIATRSIGLAEGFSIPSIRRLSNNGVKYDTEEVSLDCFLVHPIALDFFDSQALLDLTSSPKA